LDSPNTITGSAAARAKETGESTADPGESVGKRVENAKEKTSAALHTAADSVRATGRKGSKAIDEFASGAADRLHATGAYVESLDVKGPISNLRRFGSEHPGRALLAVAAVGFVTGFAFHRATHSCAETGEDN
jgi:hypothetical protein